ncbi:Uncharacterized membrane protein [Thauera humireducens]|uniref:pilus assembly protein TadG-related protein n=1 Tax=Thauera humireducens TaxID=1134435 RepID=UPI002467A270|nr:pilus assembly protein TadG-related protein [Thauera humireducens]CAH1746294.1 Uncharacterized membrane protein [Thauera humireducens]
MHRATPRPALFRLRARALQRGAIGILAALTLPIALLATVLVLDTGRLYMDRRDLQKIADTAALEAISRLPSGNCSAHESLASQNASENAAAYGFGSAEGETVTTVCVGLATDATTGVRALDNTIAADQRRAVQVTVSQVVPTSLILRAGSLFGVGGDDKITLSAQAIAEKDVVEPWAEFSVGAQLLSLGNDKLLGTLLSAVGLNTDLTVLSSAGLASAKVTPAGLLRALGVTASIDELKALSPEGLVQLVDTQVGLLGVDDLIKLGAEVVSDDTLGVGLGVLRDAVAANAVLGPATVKLFGTPSTPGLIRLATGAAGDPLGAALDAQINLGELLSAGIVAGAGGRALVIPNASLLGLATLSLGIVEPPTIALGPVGTQAYNAQVRLHLNVDTGDTWLIGDLLDMVASVRLPITIDLADARGTLKTINCSTSPATATVEVESRIGSVCVGDLLPGALWSNGASCTDLVQPTALVKLLGGTLLGGKITIPALSETDTTEPLSPGESELTGVNTLNIGTLVANLLNQLTQLLSNTNPGGVAAQPLTVTQATEIADRILALPELAPNEPGKYSNGRLWDIQDKLDRDEWQLNWDRPAFIFTSKVNWEWRSQTEQAPETGGCYIVGSVPVRYDASCARTKLIESLQTTADVGLLGKIVNTALSPLLSQVGGPLLAIILNTLMTALQPLLDSIGSVLTTVLSNILGVDLGRTNVEMRDIGCGMPRLVG